jgi:hypothetical protein
MINVSAKGLYSCYICRQFQQIRIGDSSQTTSTVDLSSGALPVFCQCFAKCAGGRTR